MKTSLIYLAFALFAVPTVTHANCRQQHTRVDADLTAYDAEAKRLRDSFTAPENLRDKEWVKAKLQNMYDVDQYMRSQTNLPVQHSYTEDEKSCFWSEFFPRWEGVDSTNTAVLKEILKIYEWITISAFGEPADTQAWLIVQHADRDPDFQKSVLVVLERLWPLGETVPKNYAFLYDRVAASWSFENKRRPQRYGTQGACKTPGDWQPIEIEDRPHLDRRRAEVGLGPFAEAKRDMDQRCH